jgi:hypothetical protein
MLLGLEPSTCRYWSRRPAATELAERMRKLTTIDVVDIPMFTDAYGLDSSSMPSWLG